MSMPQALEAAAKLGAFLKPSYADFERIRGTKGENAAMTQIFGPSQKLANLKIPKNRTIEITTITGAFFYAGTVIDTRTGALYQSKPNDFDVVWGPIRPPSSARITGPFTSKQLYDLGQVVKDSMR